MSSILDYILGLVSPSQATRSSHAESASTNASSTNPETSDGSYFPELTTSAHPNQPDMSARSSFSISSASSSTQELVTPGGTALKTTNPLPPLSREFPEPTGEIDIAKQLALAPAAHSPYSSIKRAATHAHAPKAQDAEAKARKLAEAKAELLALASR